MINQDEIPSPFPKRRTRIRAKIIERTELCPRCGTELKIVGKCGFCENKKCTVYNVKLA